MALDQNKIEADYINGVGMVLRSSYSGKSLSHYIFIYLLNM